jgi:pyruvate formate lyase activating enzyme
MRICAIQKTTLIDYPGYVAATIFLAGCNFRCPWCYAKELVFPELIIKQPDLPQDEVFEFLKSKQGYLDGVVICGGEPTLNPELPDFIKKIKKLKFKVKLDTNGSNPKMLQDLIDQKLIDYVAMDIKLPKERYSTLFAADIPVEAIEQSIKILKNSDIDFEFRTTCAPNVHTVADLVSMAKWIGPELAGRKPKYYLQNFRPERTIDPKFELLKPFPPEFFAEARKKIAPFVEKCIIR